MFDPFQLNISQYFKPRGGDDDNAGGDNIDTSNTFLFPVKDKKTEIKNSAIARSQALHNCGDQESAQSSSKPSSSKPSNFVEEMQDRPASPEEQEVFGAWNKPKNFEENYDKYFKKVDDMKETVKNTVKTLVEVFIPEEENNDSTLHNPHTTIVEWSGNIDDNNYESDNENNVNNVNNDNNNRSRSESGSESGSETPKDKGKARKS